MIVNTDEFLGRYASKAYGYGAYIPVYIYNIVPSDKTAFAELPDDTISCIESEKVRMETRDRECAAILHHWRNGLDYEIEGDYADAANDYQTGIRLAESSRFDFSHIAAVCKDRLAALSLKLQPICHE